MSGRKSRRGRQSSGPPGRRRSRLERATAVIRFLHIQIRFYSFVCIRDRISLRRIHTAGGGHFDPQNTNSHQGPYGQGHLGDLAALYVDARGKASTPTLAPRIKTTDLKGLTVMVHAGGDNYTNNPPLGGGGARIACGVVQ